MTSPVAPLRKAWSQEELRVLVAAYFNSDFSIGDDARDECRAMADAFNRAPSSIDRQWRNIAAIVNGKSGYNIGGLVRKGVSDYLHDPAGCKALALRICQTNGWPLENLVRGVPMAPLSTDGDVDLSEVSSRLVNVARGLDYKVFRTGSQGFYKNDKFALDSGRRYQVQVTAVLIGSKDNPEVQMTTTTEEISQAVRPLILLVEGKRFRTGRTGYYTSGKVDVGEERFQVGVQAVELSRHD